MVVLATDQEHACNRSGEDPVEIHHQIAHWLSATLAKTTRGTQGKLKTNSWRRRAAQALEMSTAEIPTLASSSCFLSLFRLRTVGG